VFVLPSVSGHSRERGMKTTLLFLSMLFISFGCATSRNGIDVTRSPAMIDGNEDDANSSVVQVKFPGNQACTASIVGTKPLTMAFAAHCILGSGATTPDKVTVAEIPAEKLIFDESLKDSNDDSDQLKLQFRDLAFAIFPSDLTRKLKIDDSKVFTVAPVAVRDGELVQMCGFGRTSKYYGVGNRSDYRRCGENFGFSRERMRSLAKILPDYMDDDWNEVTGPLAIWIASPSLHKRKLKSPIETVLPWIADARKNPSAYAMANSGDSGGPAFKFVDGERHLLGVLSYSNSWATEDQSKSGVSIPGMDPAKAREAMFAEYLLLTEPALKELFLKAKENGADIRGLNELLK